MTFSAVAATSMFPRAPRSRIATRILASFAVTVVAFAVTVGWSVIAQSRAARDNDELVKGYVPVLLHLGQLRAAQSSLSALVDGIPDERNPVAARAMISTLMSVRGTRLAETRAAIVHGLSDFGGESTRHLAINLLRDIDRLSPPSAHEQRDFEQLFLGLEQGDRDAVNRVLITIGAFEHGVERALRQLSDTVATQMNSLSSETKLRERRAIIALCMLAALTLAVGVIVSMHTRRLLLPLAALTDRAQAVARGDLTPHEVAVNDDEIGALSASFERMVGAVARAQERALSNERLAAIGKMAAHVTHEIRNPLSSIGLNLEMLEEELAHSSARGEAISLVHAVRHEVDRLEQLSDEYLRMARLPTPRMEANDIRRVVTSAVTFVEPEMARAGCAIRLSIDDAATFATFDEAQFRQVLLNLLRNAREAMPQGGTIDVRVGAVGMSVVVTVEDRGEGISDDIRDRVFDPFFSTKGEGTGLGLAIARQIVLAHGGTLTCATRDGGGARFEIALPIRALRSSVKTSTIVQTIVTG